MSDVLPDLVLLDWMLPGKSGATFAKELRTNDRTKQIPIIMLTARSEEQDKVMRARGRRDDYVTKPFSPKELLARIKAVLQPPRRKLTDDVVAINGLRLGPGHASRTGQDDTGLIKLDLARPSSACCTS